MGKVLNVFGKEIKNLSKIEYSAYRQAVKDELASLMSIWEKTKCVGKFKEDSREIAKKLCFKYIAGYIDKIDISRYTKNKHRNAIKIKKN